VDKVDKVDKVDEVDAVDAIGILASLRIKEKKTVTYRTGENMHLQ
jgi:hypothetical protein